MDFTFENNETPAKGKLLISDPFLSDGYFDRSVVLLCEHNTEGSFGFVLNNYLDIKFEDVADSFPDFETKISIGGPVSKENLFFIHTLGDQLPGSEKIADQIYAGGDFEMLMDMMKAQSLNKNQIRFFIGYAGWSKGQLDEEIKEHAWVVTSIPSNETIMDVDNNDLWSSIMNNLGEKFSRMTKFPQNPNLN